MSTVETALLTNPPEANVKNGIHTTEFWITALKIVIAAAVSILALLHPGFEEPSWVQGAVPIAAAVMSHLTAMMYTKYRASVKTTALANPVAALPVINQAIDAVSPAAAARFEHLESMFAQLNNGLGILQDRLDAQPAPAPAPVAPAPPAPPAAPPTPTA